jgi:hypothetical protein
MDDRSRGSIGAHVQKVTFAAAAGVPVAVAALAIATLRLPVWRVVLLGAVTAGVLFGGALVWYRRRRSIWPSTSDDPWVSIGPEPSVHRDVRFLKPVTSSSLIPDS